MSRGGCKGAEEQGAASRELSGWLCGQSRLSSDCWAKEWSGCACHGHI